MAKRSVIEVINFEKNVLDHIVKEMGTECRKHQIPKKMMQVIREGRNVKEKLFGET